MRSQIQHKLIKSALRLIRLQSEAAINATPEPLSIVWQSMAPLKAGSQTKNVNEMNFQHKALRHSPSQPSPLSFSLSLSLCLIRPWQTFALHLFMVIMLFQAKRVNCICCTGRMSDSTLPQSAGQLQQQQQQQLPIYLLISHQNRVIIFVFQCFCHLLCLGSLPSPLYPCPWSICHRLHIA